ncbi:hypothetical protein [Paraburkholderia bannensis]|uniref:hypothetical protein n=1 Tax=Paraburkholderia bannensis TaxID=765414 RepID=UPI002AC31E52|nr:hypothetical protein [Paraburkholderia bannensis]
MSETILKSSEARTGFLKFVGQVVDTGEDLLIEQNGEVVARLTSKIPGGVVQPLRIKTSDAREGWAKFLDSVIRGAKWVFVLKRAQDTPVYLVRHEKYKNEFVGRWRAHAAQERQREESASTADALRNVQFEVADGLESLRGDVDAVQEKLTLLFALVNRGGDLMNYPESGVAPLRTASDLSRFCDGEDA